MGPQFTIKKFFVINDCGELFIFTEIKGTNRLVATSFFKARERRL
jgi:hypothetical protein